jgi:hypothetical protein
MTVWIGIACFACDAPATLYCHGFVDEVARLRATCEHGTIDYQRARLESTEEADCAGLQAAVRAGRSRFDRAAAEECLQALRAVSCADFFVRVVPLRPLEFDIMDCYGLTAADPIAGNAAAGSTCYESWDCDGGYCNNLACPGQCVAFGAEGESCSVRGDSATPAQTCARGLWCDQLYEGEWVERCEALSLPSAGEFCAVGCEYGLACENYVCGSATTTAGCDFSSDCPPGYVCRDALSGACAARVSEGESCVDPTTACDEGLHCDETGICVHDSHIGEACGWTEETGYTQCLEGYCALDCESSTSYEGVCRRFSQIGESCGEVLVAGRYCSIGVCEPRLSCNDAQRCEARCSEP